MFRRCIACSSDLGTNEAIEDFPVGRRLAFDASKGRLWVVCGRCGQWNLSPLDERWEGIAAIADQLLTPAWTSERLGRGKLGEPEPWPP